MTVTVKLITEQTTNQLVDSVNKAQANNWFPVCGVVCFNARYTQLVAQDTDITTPPTCDYFIVDAEDGISFAKRVNELLAMSPGAVCLSSVQYVQARYIQAYGDDALHSAGGGDLIKWYTEDATKAYPIIDVDPNFSQIGLGNEWAGYVQLLFRTGGNNAGHILADDGTLTICKTDGSELSITDDDVNLLVKGISVLNSSGNYTNLIGQGSNVTLSPGFAGMSSPAGALELDETRGIKLYGNGGVNSIIDANPTQSTFGDLAAALNINGETITANGGNRTSLEMDASALRIKRGANNLFSISDSGGAMTWNSVIRCVWDANGWNVSRDNGVAFSSRATYSAMIGPNGSRAEASNTGFTLSSSDSPSLSSKLTMTNGTIQALVTNGSAPSLDADANGTTLRYVGNELKLTNAGLSFTTTDASGPITERLRITSTGQITAAAGYTPVADSDLATKQYVDNAVTTTVGTYNASGTSAVAVVPGKDVYYSSVASADGGLTMYAPTAGKPDVTIAAPSHAAIIINAPSGVLLRRGATTANLITIPPSTNCRFVALSATEWLVLPSGGAS